jgi:hypothetical protein
VVGDRAELVIAEDLVDDTISLSALLLFGDAFDQLNVTDMSMFLGPPAEPRQHACASGVDVIQEATAGSPQFEVHCVLEAPLGISMSLSLWLDAPPDDNATRTALEAAFTMPLIYPLRIATSLDTVSFPLKVQPNTLSADRLGYTVRDVPKELAFQAFNLPNASALAVDLIRVDDGTILPDACEVRCLFLFWVLVSCDACLSLSSLTLSLAAGNP